MSILKKLTSISWTSIFSELSTFAVRFGLLSLFVLLMVVIFRGLKQEGYSVQPFQVPKNLNEAGYNGQVVALLIQDQVQELKMVANSQREDSLDLNVELRPDLNLDVMGVGLSATSMIYHLRDLLGRENETIAGNITDMDNEMTMNIRMTGFHAESIRILYENDEKHETLERLIDKGALHVLKNTDPYRLAIVLYRRGQVDEAVDVIRDIIRDRPQDRKWAYHFWANVDSQKGDREKAIENYKMAIAEDPDFALPRGMLGWNLFNDGEYELALEQFEKALQINPLESSMHNGAALCYRNLGNLDKADEHYNDQIEKYPDRIWSYGNYSDFLMRFKKDTVKATELWRKASEALEVSGDYYISLAAFHSMNEDSIQALSYGKKALELEPDNVSALRQMSNFYYQLEDFSKAEMHFKKLTKVYQKGEFDVGMRISAYNMLSMSEYQQEKWDSSLVHVQMAIDLSPDQPFPYSTLAEIYLLQNKIELFFTTIEKALSLGLPLKEFVKDYPYNLVKNQNRLQRLIEKYEKENALKG